MNQILSTSMPISDRINRNKQPIDIKNILKFFAIAILVFGVFMLGTGVYAICNNQGKKQEKNLEPTISIENKTETSILLKVMHQMNIDKVEYRWNDEEKITVNGNNGKYLEKEINIPSGTNTLHVLVIDENGKEITYEKSYELESNINFEVAGNKIKITYDGDKQVSYMKYRWDDGEETRVDINGTSIEQEIEAIKGLHELTVVVVDEDDNTDTKVQKINGVSKPKLEISIDEQGTHFIIKASDDDQLSKIHFRLNQDDTKVYGLNLEDMNMKDLEYVLPMELQSGENIIEVTVYNINGITEERGARVVK